MAGGEVAMASDGEAVAAAAAAHARGSSGGGYSPSHVWRQR